MITIYIIIRWLLERGHLGDTDVDGRIILRWIFRKCDWGMDWIQLAQDSDRWQALVNVLMNLWVPCNVGNFLTNRKPVSFSRTTLLHVVTIYKQQALTNTAQNKLISAARLEVPEGPVALLRQLVCFGE